MTVVVAIPIYKAALTDLERQSLSQCVTVLGRYPLVFFGPSSLNADTYLRVAPSAAVQRFDDRYFSAVEGYSRLLLSESFYESLAHFDYVLIHQLDAFVFYDALQYWCSRDFDYLGAPFRNETDSGWMGVGNGGLSLRRIQSCLAVLRCSRKEHVPSYWRMERLVTTSRLKLALKSYRWVKKQIGFRDDVKRFLARFLEEGRPEDIFWGLHASRFHRAFRVAPVDAALDFAIEGGLMETRARYLLQPPFGCHQTRFLRMIERFLAGLPRPADAYEAAVWTLAAKAGLSPEPMKRETRSE